MPGFGRPVPPHPTRTDGIAAAFMRAQKEAMMDKTSRLFSDILAENTHPASKISASFSNSKNPIADKRVAQLLVVLHELDECVARLEELSTTELNELVSSAIFACGFVQQNEAHQAITTILEAIETRDSISEFS
jgi:hypothetical protein